jgi:hypothetical protein
MSAGRIERAGEAGMTAVERFDERDGLVAESAEEDRTFLRQAGSSLGLARSSATMHR